MKDAAHSWQAVVFQDEDGAWCAEVPSLPGCVSAGDSRDDAVTNIREALAAWLETQRRLGRPMPPPDRRVEVVAIPA